jgi:hypothetical protein
MNCFSGRPQDCGEAGSVVELATGRMWKVISGLCNVCGNSRIRPSIYKADFDEAPLGPIGNLRSSGALPFFPLETSERFRLKYPDSKIAMVLLLLIFFVLIV